MGAAARRATEGGRPFRDELLDDAAITRPSLSRGRGPRARPGRATSALPHAFVDRALERYRERAVTASSITASTARRTRRWSCSRTRSAWRSRCGTGRCPALSERFRVLRYDQRGHGGTAAPPGPYAIADLGRDALALLDELGLDRRGVLRLLAGRHDGAVARDQRARADRPAGALLHDRPPAPAGDVDRARGHRPRAGDGAARGGRARALVHARARRAATGGPGATRGGCSAPWTPRATPAAARRSPITTCAPRSAGSRRPRVIIAGADDPATPPDHGAPDGGGDRRRAPRRAGRRAPPGEHRAPGRREPRAARAPDRGSARHDATRHTSAA